MVVDEGHRLKNHNCRLMKELKMYNPEASRLLLTGTPLQNNVAELWSLLNFLCPDIFSDLEFFESFFGFDSRDDKEMEDEIREAQKGNQLVSTLHSILRPFLMRRLKRDVTTLPPKREAVVYTELTQTQDHLYNQILQNNLAEMLKKLHAARGDSASIP